METLWYQCSSLRYFGNILKNVLCTQIRYKEKWIFMTAWFWWTVIYCVQRSSIKSIQTFSIATHNTGSLTNTYICTPILCRGKHLKSYYSVEVYQGSLDRAYDVLTDICDDHVIWWPRGEWTEWIPNLVYDSYDSQRSAHLHRVDKVRWSRRVCKRPRKCWKFSK